MAEYARYSAPRPRGFAHGRPRFAAQMPARRPGAAAALRWGGAPGVGRALWNQLFACRREHL